MRLESRPSETFQVALSRNEQGKGAAICVGQNGGGTLAFCRAAPGASVTMWTFLVTSVSKASVSQETSFLGLVPAIVKQAVMKRLCNKSILIIDDDAGMLRALDKVLTSEGALVNCSESAENVMEILTGRRKGVDLVITDLRMPYVTGMTVLYVIREAFPALPIMVLTAYSSPAVKAECLRQGATAIVEKPLDTPQLLSAIEGVFAAQETGPGK
jgi:CheY-like chemotaxis protein